MTKDMPTPHAPVLVLALLAGFGPGTATGAEAPPDRAAAPASGTAAPADTDDSPASLGRVTVRGKRLQDIGPMPGLALDRDRIPGNVQGATRADLAESHATDLASYMQRNFQSVSVNDYAGNPFQLDLNYRGFTASPQVGTAQGLSVFFDGVRVNEPFGDVVNWDLIPMNALERFDLFPGSNPLFGLNTLGGALSMRSRNGFSSTGGEVEVLGGSWGRRQLKGSIGGNDGRFAGFAAANVFDEDGWRSNSPSRVRQVFGRGDWRGDEASLTASLLHASNRLVGNGLVPMEMAREDWSAVFTSPDEARNQATQLSLAGQLDLDDSRSITAQIYRRDSRRTGVTGDIYEGFSDMSADRDVVPDRVVPNTSGLPVCQYVDANGDGAADGQAPLNGPRGSGCVDLGLAPGPDSGKPRNGGSATGYGGAVVGGSGVAAGTPIGLLTRTALRQMSDGAAVQGNWNLDRHRFMIGAALDRSRADYRMSQQLGLIDANHNVYAAPDQIDPMYRAAQSEVVGNDFDGHSRTASLYFSETWSARDNLHFTFAARANHSRVQTTVRTPTNANGLALHELRNRNTPPTRILCPTSDPASCPSEPQVSQLDLSDRAQTVTTDDLTYRSINPAIGFNWLPRPDMNVFGNLSQGARVPSVIELGCAFDSTPVPVNPDVPAWGTTARSLRGPTCSLPTTLSGDPWLPQIRSLSGELGLRGALDEHWEWNASVYRTDLRNDIYFVGVADGRSYFDTIGKTRRQGLELGLKGRYGAFDIKLGYAFVDATFQSGFYMASPHNSSADFDQNSRGGSDVPGQDTLPGTNAGANRGYGTYRMTRVDPGARLPGIPAHNLTLNLGWQATNELRLGLGMIARSLAYLRGNENNQHATGGSDQETGIYLCSTGNCDPDTGLQQVAVAQGRPFNNPGHVGGYAVFNADASWRLTRATTLFMQIGNLFDTRYYSAGRLGINPFTSGATGARGASGWNYNSSEWANASMVAPGAPRSIFVGLSHRFDAD
ncbi:TonB-dependent receptor [Derxia gummosa]|uniref:TonB-dependent receptor n=1 Tax=Derxia gummosa DSM 723 TaxID=1121388 RepID=A0A9U5GIT0_9BURK|nr:TonB-dependent receptor [Derxia gummosa]